MASLLQNEACRALDDAFAKLSADWEGHEIGLVAKVDCSDPKADILCQEYGVLTLPLLLYGDADSPEFYESDDISYEALSAFCKENISQPPCNVRNLKNCGETERAILHDLLSKPRAELEAMEEKIDIQVSEVEKEFDDKIAQIQMQYTKVVKEFNDALDKVRKETNYKWLQQVLHQMDMLEDGLGDEL